MFRAIVDQGALVNNAATEEGGGSPARGAVPETTAEAAGDGTWRLSGEKTWTTWLPNLTHAFVTARLAGTDPAELGVWLVRARCVPAWNDGPGSRRWACVGQHRGGCAWTGVAGPRGRALVRRRAGVPIRAVRRPEPGSGSLIAAAYLGIGEGARKASHAGRSTAGPGDGSTAVADLPSVQLRLGRMDAELRAARIVVLDVVRRWDAAVVADDAAGLAAAAEDLALAKLVATEPP